MAMLLGPAGFGLAGLYMSVASLTQNVAGMGVNSSGVRQIAEAVGTQDAARISGTAAVLRKASLVLGLLGALILLLFAAPISKATFGTYERTHGVYLLSAAVFLNLVSAGQGALIQGMRRISDLAKMSVLGALFGTFATIPLVYLFREDGVVPSLVAVAAVTFATSWWYSREIEIGRTCLTATQVRRETAGLLKLGVAFMASGIMTMGSAYIIRILISNQLGLEATGLYQAAWTLGGLYVGLILQAMGSDFYPRLTAVARDNEQCNRIVNEQVQISMLLAGPGVLATLTLTPLVLSMFYAPDFIMAVDTLRWICLGIAMRVISWPLGYILVAKGAQTLFIGSDLAWTLVHLVLAFVLVGRYGLSGAGVAFFGSYVFHIAFNYSLVRRLSGFRWSSKSAQTALGYLTTLVVAFYAVRYSKIDGVYVGLLFTLLSGAFSVRSLLVLASSNSASGYNHKLFNNRLSPLLLRALRIR
jgi:PST family polysaccharide transporter